MVSRDADSVAAGIRRDLIRRGAAEGGEGRPLLGQLPRLRRIDRRKYLSEIRPSIGTITEIQRGFHRTQVLVHPFACTFCVALLDEVQ